VPTPTPTRPSSPAAPTPACCTTSNDKLLNDNTLVLIDAGCEVAGYAADITRTFPVSGRFNAAQRDVYEIVLAAQRRRDRRHRPGRHFMEGHDAAVRVLTQGLIDLKLLTGASTT
jgi:Xaa-Pro aminopeptidase